MGSTAPTVLDVTFVGHLTDRWRSAEGAPSPLGVVWLEAEQAFNFALYSRYATAVTLLCYAPRDPVHPVYTFALDPRRHKTGRVWHCRVPAAQLEGAATTPTASTARPGSTRGTASIPRRCSSTRTPRRCTSRLASPAPPARVPGRRTGGPPWGCSPRRGRCTTGATTGGPRHASDLIIYELHVKGFTARPSSGVSPEQRGTFAGLKAKIPYLATWA